MAGKSLNSRYHRGIPGELWKTLRKLGCQVNRVWRWLNEWEPELGPFWTGGNTHLYRYNSFSHHGAPRLRDTRRLFSEKANVLDTKSELATEAYWIRKSSMWPCHLRNGETPSVHWLTWEKYSCVHNAGQMRELPNINSDLEIGPKGHMQKKGTKPNTDGPRDVHHPRLSSASQKEPHLTKQAHK